MIEHYIYIIGHRTVSGYEGPVKVGITKALGSRLASIQTGNWRKIGFAHTFALPSREIAEYTERQFHEDFAESRMCGEWFGMEPFDALEGLCNTLISVFDDRFVGADLERVHITSGLREKYRQVADFYDGAIA